MTILFFIVLIPLAISLAAKFVLRWDISWLEFGVQALVGTLILVMIWLGGSLSAADDVEIWNGQVTKIYSERFQCPTNTSEMRCQNGYDCNPRRVCTTSTNSDGKRVEDCRVEYDRCYRYTWEQDWYIDTNVHRGRLTVSRVDAQGRRAPPRWQSAYVGEPAAATNRYKNWVKASSDSMFHQSRQADETFAQLLREQPPVKIHDLYRVDRIITPGWRFAGDHQWNLALAEILKDLGPRKEMNLVFVITRNTTPEFAYAQQRAWQGFKKNDTVVFLGVDNRGTIQWADVMSWSRQDIYNVKMRHVFNDLRGRSINALDPTVLMAEIRTVAGQHFQRRSMEEFEYLKSEIPPPTWLVVLSVIGAILFGIGTSILFRNTDLGGKTWTI